ncbi:hypothetical protein TEA_010681 [Camellia sinensis var. sinensis]|uniref:Uncharacterized protein n=1 Tax=Camellia sinensis var. sinensis TaxID=542762 RepID=A0A4S4E4C5_CAMSN|nr:hypothetical protein TEA_010681 [Camellia sinensis var. sinensis]
MSMELGCDACGYSRAGNETTIWYCVILAGRSSPELNKMRATLRRIQEALSTVDNDQPSSLAVVALKEKQLTFTWLDEEAQQTCTSQFEACNTCAPCTPSAHKCEELCYMDSSISPTVLVSTGYDIAVKHGYSENIAIVIMGIGTRTVRYMMGTSGIHQAMGH